MRVAQVLVVRSRAFLDAQFCFPGMLWRRRGRAYAIFPQMGKAISSICKGPSYHSAWSRIIKDGTRTAVGAAAAMRSKSSVVFSFEIIFL